MAPESFSAKEEPEREAYNLRKEQFGLEFP
jgi:hypothetical protein